MKTTRVFDKLVEAEYQHPRYIVNEGGARSSKTYSTLQLLSLLAENDKKPTITSVVSESMPHLKRGCIRDFKAIMVARNIWNEDAWSKVESIYTFPNGSIIEFFSADQSGKVLGAARDRLYVNECNHIDYEIMRQLSIRTRGRIFIDYNPSYSFWAHDKIIPREDALLIHSTYRDNPFLSPEQIAEIESNKNDARWWRVFGEGLVGVNEGIVYDFETIDTMPDSYGLTEVYGMDFGFTNDPTACVRLLADTGRKIVHVDEIIYKTRMLNSDIINELRSHGATRSPIYADCAEPKSIAEIANAGFNIRPCDKNAPVRSDKLNFQIQFVQGWKLMVTKRSLNVINELRNYTWDKDKDGNDLNYPIDKYNHSLDALRYALYTHFGKAAGYGRYTINI